MASVKLQQGGKKNEFTETYVATDPERMPWRELASILAVRETNGRKSALALRHLDSLQEKDFMLWTGGLNSDKAKEIDTVEWKTHLSVSMLEQPAMHRYEEAIALADRQQLCLRFSTKEYARGMLVDDASRFYQPAERIYWDLLAQPENQRLVQDVGSVTYMEDWKGATRAAAEEAYRRACPAVTARQMEAYTQGLSRLPVREGGKA